jgi:hypothetical protein
MPLFDAVADLQADVIRKRNNVAVQFADDVTVRSGKKLKTDTLQVGNTTVTAIGTGTLSLPAATGTLALTNQLGGVGNTSFASSATVPRTATFPDSTGNVVLDTATQTLTNKTLTTPTITGSGGTLTLPAGPSTLVDTSSTQTLTNKTLTTPNLTGALKAFGSTLVNPSTTT